MSYRLGNSVAFAQKIYRPLMTQIEVPKNSCGNRPPRLPLTTQLAKFLWRGSARHLFHSFNGNGERQIAGGPNIRATHRHHKVDICRPRADTFDPHQLRFGFRIIKEIQFRQIQVSLPDRLSKMTSIQGFLAAKPNHLQFGIREFHEAFGREWLRDRHQPIKGGPRRCQRHLLFENNMD